MPEASDEDRHETYATATNSAALFLQDPQVLGVDALKGSQMIFAVVFKTLATKQFGPMREFQRRVRLALQEHDLLPGDPYRIFNTFTAEDRDNPAGAAIGATRGHGETGAHSGARSNHPQARRGESLRQWLAALPEPLSIAKSSIL